MAEPAQHPDAHFGCRCETHGSVVVVSVHGEVDMATAPTVAGVLCGPVDAGSDVIVDLGNVAFIDSCGVRVLLNACLDVRAAGGSFTVERSTPAVLRVFDALGLTRLLQEPSCAANSGAVTDPAS